MLLSFVFLGAKNVSEMWLQQCVATAQTAKQTMVHLQDVFKNHIILSRFGTLIGLHILLTCRLQISSFGAISKTMFI